MCNHLKFTSKLLQSSQVKRNKRQIIPSREKLYLPPKMARQLKKDYIHSCNIHILSEGIFWIDYITNSAAVFLVNTTLSTVVYASWRAYELPDSQTLPIIADDLSGKVNHRSSLLEMEYLFYVRSQHPDLIFGFNSKQAEIRIGKKVYFLDGYSSEAKTAFEFCGCQVILIFLNI